MTKCRQRTQNETTGHRGRKGDPLYGIRKLLLSGAERLDAQGHMRLQTALDQGDPLYGIRKLLLSGAERLDAQGHMRLQTALDQGDPHDEVADCWTAKEKVRSVFKTRDSQQAAARLDDAIAWCAAPESGPELHRLATTLHRWRDEIETSIKTRTHNGRTEAANAKIKDVKRSARGFRNLANYRLRILLAAGQKPRETQPVTKIRTRRPSFNA